jgi:PAS domain S-box-containing protein
MAVKLLSNTNGVQKPGERIGYLGKPITETVANGFFTVDRKWTVGYWNKAAEKLLDVQAKDIVGKNLWEEFAGIIPLDFYAAYHKAFLKDIPVHFEEYWGEMGTWFDVITYYSDGTLSVSFKSRSHPHHSASPGQQLRAQNELYRFVSEVTNDCLWDWDLQTKELFWIDGGHKRVFGYQIENALVPQSFWESCLHPEDRSRVLKKLHQAFAVESCNTWEDEYRFQRADGSYAYVHDRGHIIYSSDKVASRIVGATQDITARKSAEMSLLESGKKLVKERLTRQRRITDAVLTAQEKERSDIGEELHDNVNQILATTLLYIEMAKKDKGSKKNHLEKSYSLIMDVIEELRRISKTLIPLGMSHIGLIKSIKSLSHDLAAAHPIVIGINMDGVTEEGLSEKMRLNIFRIVQEQLNNILKHSKATHAEINLTRKANEMILLISDNGEGCDLSKEKKGIGIINIKNRADLYHGKVTVTSKPGEGYELKVVLLLNSKT